MVSPWSYESSGMWISGTGLTHEPSMEQDEESGLLGVAFNDPERLLGKQNPNHLLKMSVFSVISQYSYL